MEHYNATANDLHSGRYAPVFDVDLRHDEILWELWIDGLKTAMQLRPESWATIVSSDDDTRTALSGLITLADISRGDSRLSKAEIDDLTEKAPDLIPHWVETLDTWRIGQHLASQRPTTAPIVGQGRTQRSISLRLRQEIQEMLRPQLTVTRSPDAY